MLDFDANSKVCIHPRVRPGARTFAGGDVFGGTPQQ